MLLTPTRIYVEPVLAARRGGLTLHGMAHITGGGLPENLPRCLGPDQSIHLDLGSWPVPPVFTWLATTGQVPEVDLYHTFNMGLGFALVVPPEAVDLALSWFAQRQVASYLVGEVVPGSGKVSGLPAEPPLGPLSTHALNQNLNRNLAKTLLKNYPPSLNSRYCGEAVRLGSSVEIFDSKLVASGAQFSCYFGPGPDHQQLCDHQPRPGRGAEHSG